MNRGVRHIAFAALLFAAACQTAFARPQPTPDAPPSEYRPLARHDMILAGATILDGAGGKTVGDILIRDGKIAAVGEIRDQRNAVRIDASGRWITPGLIDIHTHYGTFLLPQTAAELENSDVTETSSFNVADTWIEHAVRPADPAFSRALASGVTTLQILPGSSVLIGGRSVVVHPIPAVTLAQMRFPGAPQGLKMACGSNSVNDSSFPTSRQGQIAGIRRAFHEARHRMEEDDEDEHEDRDGRGHGRWDPRNATLIGAIRGELPVHLHCYRAEDIANWISALKEFGVRIAAVHHAAEAYKIAPLLAEEGVCAAVWPDWWGFKREAEDAIPENAAFVDAAGGCAIMHSDIPVVGGLLNLDAARAAAAGRRAGLDIPPKRAIRWITSNAARALGLGDRIGTIATGMNADLVIWSGDPFSIYSKPDQVIIDGAIAFDRSDPSRQPVPDFELGRPQREGIR
ncbi:MAG: amidohydrolase family protein [Novosphingobium sp.]|nr:amidohydrolase family protein [Novosphingobium sp.]